MMLPSSKQVGHQSNGSGLPQSTCKHGCLALKFALWMHFQPIQMALK